MPESDAESERAVGADGVVRFFAQVRGDLWPERPLTGAASSSVQGESGGSPSDPSSCAALFSTHVSWRAGPAVSPSAWAPLRTCPAIREECHRACYSID